MTLHESQLACQKLTRKTAKNFGLTFRVLPSDQARDMATLYAFMRHTDDLADRDAPSGERRIDLESWRTAFHNAVAARDGEPSVGVAGEAYLPAVAELVRRREIPAANFDAVIDGCLQDTNAVAIETREELEQYCYRVAGAVGLCCLAIWGYAGQRLPGTAEDRERAEQLAVRTGFAFQLTNIIRDLSEDASLGRRYLPAEDLQRFDIADSDLIAHQEGPPEGRLRDLLAYEVEQAKSAYQESAALSDVLSPEGRRVLKAMRGIYGGILTEIEKRHYDVFTARVSISRWRKAFAIINAFLTR